MDHTDMSTPNSDWAKFIYMSIINKNLDLFWI